MQNQIETIARAIITNENNILLCKVKENEYYFLPGGHVESKEYAENALSRELKEEIGEEVFDIRFIGINENIFIQKGKGRQEVNIIFEAKLKNKNIKVLENHLEFKWVSFEEFVNEKILPEGMKKAVIAWKENNKTFYSKQ